MLYPVHLAWEGFELITLVVIGTDCIDMYNSTYHTITTTTASTRHFIFWNYKIYEQCLLSDPPLFIPNSVISSSGHYLLFWAEYWVQCGTDAKGWYLETHIDHVRFHPWRPSSSSNWYHILLLSGSQGVWLADIQNDLFRNQSFTCTETLK